MTDEEFIDTLETSPPAIILEARDRYFHDQEELLAHRSAHPDEKWVAYHGQKRLGFGKSQIELIRHGLDRGLSIRDFIVLGIDASVQRVMSATL
jgi:hypothetical protein